MESNHVNPRRGERREVRTGELQPFCTVDHLSTHATFLAIHGPRDNIFQSVPVAGGQLQTQTVPGCAPGASDAVPIEFLVFPLHSAACIGFQSTQTTCPQLSGMSQGRKGKAQ